MNQTYPKVMLLREEEGVTKLLAATGQRWQRDRRRESDWNLLSCPCGRSPNEPILAWSTLPSESDNQNTLTSCNPLAESQWVRSQGAAQGGWKKDFDFVLTPCFFAGPPRQQCSWRGLCTCCWNHDKYTLSHTHPSCLRGIFIHEQEKTVLHANPSHLFWIHLIPF